MIKNKKLSGIPIQVFVGSIIVFSMLILAVVLTGASYFYSRASLIEQAENTAEQTTTALENQIEYVTKSASQSLQMLAYDTLVSQKSIEERLFRLPSMARIMQFNSLLSAVYVGYEDGDFFLLRALKNNHARQLLSAPDDAAYLLQAIDRNELGEITHTRWEFFDQKLNTIGTLTSPNDYLYDPRSRPWFRHAAKSHEVIVTDPYAFYTTEEIGASFAVKNPSSGAIVGVDAAISDISNLIQTLKSSSQVEIALVDQQNLVLGNSNPNIELLKYIGSTPRLTSLDELPNSPLYYVPTSENSTHNLIQFQANNQVWYGTSIPVSSESISGWRLIFAIPRSVLLATVHQNLLHQLLFSLGIILILVTFGWLIGRSISRPLKQLSQEVSALASFDFERIIAVDSLVKEINILSTLTNHMALTIRNFQSISHKLANDRDLEQMLHQVSEHLIAITSSEAGAVYLCHSDSSVLELATQTNMEALRNIHYAESNWLSIQDTLTKQFESQNKRVFLSPLLDRNSAILGVLVLILSEESTVKETSFQRFIDEISGAAATAISTRRQFEAQQALLDGIIRLLADAIDAKSAYTSGHCERVPELAEMLADAAQASTLDELSEFTMNEFERREFHIAAWLHDCGKITSPEHVVDKATKLETINNRIHEIRTRFEVLWRDTEIECLQGQLNGQDPVQLQQQKSAKQQQLKQDFAFIANANIGGEFMADADIDRLASIGSQTWIRHFSSHIGLSQMESANLPQEIEVLPTQECLLADKPEHIEEWGERRPPIEKDNPNNIWGFDMDVPQQAFNKGELYNLSVKRGTLTEEERFVVKDHMVQTIKMLSSLPFPEELKNVPNIAGNHHEQMDGNGYPRRLARKDLSVQEKILAIADVFEALTASDRPYKTAKKLSESLKILAFMVRDNHLDGTLFKLFITSKTYLMYAEQFLRPEQIDKIDPQQLFTWAGLINTTQRI